MRARTCVCVCVCACEGFGGFWAMFGRDFERFHGWESDLDLHVSSLPFPELFKGTKNVRIGASPAILARGPSAARVCACVREGGDIGRGTLPFTHHHSCASCKLCLDLRFAWGKGPTLYPSA